MIHILNVEPLGYSEEARGLLRQVGELVEMPFCRAELLAQLRDYDVLIVRLAHQIDHEVIDAGPRLKAIVSATTGLDHIDVDYAASKGIAVLSLRGEIDFLRTISATAEHTWALLLSLLRRIPGACAAVQAGEWDRDAYRGHELDGKCLGIMGLGRLGHKIARYGQAFNMQVIAYDPFASEWVDGVERCTGLADFLRRSDVLTIHVPLNPETTHLIDAAALALLPPGAVLINTSRGEVVDETALIHALESGHLLGAALDVITHERDPYRRQNGPLLAYARTHDTLLITPHVAGATYESMAKTELFMARKLVDFLRDM